MIARLALGDTLLAQLEAEARATFPRECCGLIEVVREGQVLAVAALHPAANQAAETGCFAIDPAAHIALSRAARAKGREIAGCYHSHPGGVAAPSARDRENGAQGFVWLIAALDGPAGKVALGAFEGLSFRALEVSRRGPL